MVKPGGEQADGDAGRGDHEQGVEDVVAGDDARAVRGLGADLDQRIQRHDVEAAEEADEKEVAEDAPVAGVLQEGRQRHRLVLQVRGEREIEVDAEQRHADRAEGHQADLHLVAGEALAQPASRRRCRSRRRSAAASPPTPGRRGCPSTGWGTA
jgi:hypothetical protein